MHHAPCLPDTKATECLDDQTQRFRRNGKFEEVLANISIETIENEFIQVLSLVNNAADSDSDGEDGANVDADDEAGILFNDGGNPMIAERVWCTCQGNENEDMIQCNWNKNCKGFEWYHFECVDVDPENIPDVWICELCN